MIAGGDDERRQTYNVDDGGSRAIPRKMLLSLSQRIY